MYRVHRRASCEPGNRQSHGRGGIGLGDQKRRLARYRRPERRSPRNQEWSWPRPHDCRDYPIARIVTLFPTSGAAVCFFHSASLSFYAGRTEWRENRPQPGKLEPSAKLTTSMNSLSRARTPESMAVHSRWARHFCRAAGACSLYLQLRLTWRQRGFRLPLRLGPAH